MTSVLVFAGKILGGIEPICRIDKLVVQMTAPHLVQMVKNNARIEALQRQKSYYVGLT